MLLLSALLASLTGLVAGERPAERAQVELSAAAAVAQSSQAVASVGKPAIAEVARPRALPRAEAPIANASPARSARALRLSKQSWLI